VLDCIAAPIGPPVHLKRAENRPSRPRPIARRPTAGPARNLRSLGRHDRGFGVLQPLSGTRTSPRARPSLA